MRTMDLPEYVDVLPANICESKSSFLHLWIDLDLKLMYTEWLRRPTIEEYQQGCKLFIRMVKKHAITFWILDSNKLEGLPIEEQRQIIRQLGPSLMASSLQKVARVIARDVDNVVMFEEIASELKRIYKSTIEVERFFAFKDAADWIGMIRN